MNINALFSLKVIRNIINKTIIYVAVVVLTCYFQYFLPSSKLNVKIMYS